MTIERPPRLRSAAQLAGEVGGSGKAAVGHQRIRADDHEVVGAVQIRHRERHGAAEHQPERHMLGHLIERARRVDLMGAEAADDQRRVQRAGHGVGVGIAEVHPHRCAAVVADRGAEAVGHRGERLFPRRLGQHAIPTNQRRTQPVGVVVEFSEARALRTDESGGEHVVAVAARSGDVAVLDGQRQAARGFAERADA